METSRRSVLIGGLAASTVAIPVTGLVDSRATAASAPLRSDPFTLGVASGDPLPDGFVIWTRLAPSPIEPDGLGGMPPTRQLVNWQVATDPAFTDVVRAGEVNAGPEWAHAVHVEVGGLLPGRDYWYRFRTGRWLSRAGRARTAPSYDVMPSALSMAFVSCSNFPAGYFTAYRRLAEERPDLILANYRQRHAQYKTDADLQEAHAAAPWLVVWDDHEVDNNYADETADRAVEQPGFLDRRAAAYRAYYENMPLRRTSVPSGPDLQLFRRVHWGKLASFHMLDTRQYRSDQSCGDGYKDCPDAADPARSLPGMAQEEWLLDGFRTSDARWDVLGQQVFFGRRDNNPTAASTVSMDAWDGYPASRQRITQGWVDAGVRNPVVLTGDVHAHWASELNLDAADPTSPVVGSELVTSSISSGGNGYDAPTGQHPWAAWNPNLRFWTNLRGYVSTTITPASFTSRSPRTPCGTKERSTSPGRARRGSDRSGSRRCSPTRRTPWPAAGRA